jgi:hypothetical protein
MHYAIPANWLKRGSPVGNNTTLSAGDKAIIREMYPFDNLDASPIVIFNNIDAEYNVYENKIKGMQVKVDFTIKKAYKQKLLLAVYFYDVNGKALKDTNKKLYTTSGKVAVSKYFIPNYESSRFGSYTLFMPIRELDLPCGEYKLKFRVAVFKESTMIENSGFSYFTYRKKCKIELSL